MEGLAAWGGAGKALVLRNVADESVTMIAGALT